VAASPAVCAAESAPAARDAVLIEACDCRGCARHVACWLECVRNLLAAGAIALGTASCYAYAEPAYVEARYVPDYVYSYPSVYYEGRPVYLIDGRWYFDRGGRWVYYRDEPDVLYRQRVYIQQAPEAERRRYYRPPSVAPYTTVPPARQSAPPARQIAPPARQSAPPARQSAPPARQSAPPARQSAPPAPR